MSGPDPQRSAPRYRIAYGSVPKDGGTFTFYRNLRPALAAHGVELLCVTVGSQQAALVEPAYADEGCVLLAPGIASVRDQARAFVEWCERERVDIVMAINSVAILSALPHLPSRVRVVARCANAFDEGYRVTLAGRERLARIVALTPRLRDNLVHDYGVSPDAITLIPNGIDPAPYDALADSGSRTGSDAPAHTDRQPLELGFLGRLEHTQKGVLYLPQIVKSLEGLGVDFRLRIVGKGKHEPELRKRLAAFAGIGRVQFVGSVPADEVPGFLSSLDALLFTSHFEGCPNTLLEAMMAGVTTVAFQIEGIVDFLLDHERTGIVVPSGDCDGFAARIAELAAQPDRRIAMSRAAAQEARRRFTPAIAAQQYVEVFDAVMASPPPPASPRPWSAFAVDPVYDPGWKAFVPEGVKRLVRRLRGR